MCSKWLLVLLLFCSVDGVLAQDHRFFVTDANGPAGSTRSVEVRLDVNASPIQGWSLGVCHAMPELTPASANAGVTTSTVNGGFAPDFISVTVLADGVQMGVVIDTDVVNTLGVGTNYDILHVDYDLNGPGGTTATVELCDTVGMPPTMTVVVVGGLALVPLQDPGTITITNFERADFDGDSVFGIGDGDQVLDYLFDAAPGPLDCYDFVNLDVADANDNEYITIADYLKIRNAIVGGGSIPAPFAGCGDDPTTSTGGFESEDSAFRVSIGDLTLLPPVGPTNRRVAFPINIETPVAIKGVTIILQYDDVALRPFDPLTGSPSAPVLSAGTNRLLDQAGVLVISIWSTTDAGNIAVAAPGVFQNVGTLFMHLEDNFVFPPLEYAPELVVGSVLHRATVVDASFVDHHPQLLTGEFEFVRGNANSDNAVDIGDPIFMLNYLFTNGPSPNCLDAADGNNDSRIDIADPIFVLNWLFSGGPIIPQPYPQCGLDVGPIDFLPCAPAVPSDACFE
ncbi:MAG: hypothetical protein AB7O52_10980 [Planctomycetota bacterium]